MAWSTSDTRVNTITATGDNPVVALVPFTPLPASIQFTATITYPDGCVYTDDFIASFSFFKPLMGIDNQMSISPNPAGGNQLNVDFNTQVTGSLEVYQLISGVKIKTMEVSDSKSVLIGLDAVEKGMYLIKFTNDFGATIVKKVIIE